MPVFCQQWLMHSALILLQASSAHSMACFTSTFSVGEEISPRLASMSIRVIRDCSVIFKLYRLIVYLQEHQSLRRLHLYPTAIFCVDWQVFSWQINSACRFEGSSREVFEGEAQSPLWSLPSPLTAQNWRLTPEKTLSGHSCVQFEQSLAARPPAMKNFLKLNLCASHGVM